jgi:hypothetical protein
VATRDAQRIGAFRSELRAGHPGRV